ncbi:hypothetical protein [Photobacterium angustum]|uniref:Uncharacterized protein n=1 Tax=Photobacterium angustum TaxID=661 RepID=A0A855SEH7_PHOAN|nr:hypothetical protein [Photobacterium angustum]KJF83575.1 hypothetical protein UB36_03325 [Photobacterium damselae subsp. damselae]KJG42560.1 hypothetical protein UA35_00735 [Photobacterium angustum]KJG47883.1 hypothetical protein UA31_03325 [Photobacterium angustum]KJG49859.1 hypothetical protein UA30_04865 [Photobacterium angustum]KJG54048.1 hypothetical protein UA34_07285 [Photobacterium angustum]
MNYVAVSLGADGGIVRHRKTAEVQAVLLGEFEQKHIAVEQAKAQLGCEFEIKGVLVKGNHQGGWLVCDSQELTEL